MAILGAAPIDPSLGLGRGVGLPVLPVTVFPPPRSRHGRSVAPPPLDPLHVSEHACAGSCVCPCAHACAGGSRVIGVSIHTRVCGVGAERYMQGRVCDACAPGSATRTRMYMYVIDTRGLLGLYIRGAHTYGSGCYMCTRVWAHVGSTCMLQHMCLCTWWGVHVCKEVL